MRGRSLSILGIFAAVIGAIFILCHTTIKVTGVTITAGILFVGVGLVNLIFFSSISKDDNASARVLTLVSNAAAIVLGVSMLVFQKVFAPLIAFIFGLLVAVCALWQFFVLAVGARPYQLPTWLYLFPVILAGGATYIFLRPGVNEDHLLMLATGISMAVLGIACVVEGSILGVARRADRAKAMAQAEAQAATPTEATVVDDATAASPVETPKPAKKAIETTDDLDDEIITTLNH